MTLTDTAYDKALEVLRRCVSPLGFKVSALSGGYPQVWARDAPITALGALLTGDAELNSSPAPRRLWGRSAADRPTSA